MTDLSGRVTTLENQMVMVNQDILLRPDLTTYDTLSLGINNQLSTISNVVNDLQLTVRTLQSMYITLAQLNNSRYASFVALSGDFISVQANMTGYTGIPGATGITGAISTLYRRLTGVLTGSAFTGFTGAP